MVKPLGAYLRGGCPGVSGATVRGDGRVVLIVDVGAVLDLATRMEYVQAPRGQDSTAHAHVGSENDT